MKKIFTIIGPTAVGKTNISIKIAKLIKGQVVGLDSRQIYKGMSIGTAQPNKIEMQSIVHHLIGKEIHGNRSLQVNIQKWLLKVLIA